MSHECRCGEVDNGTNSARESAFPMIEVQAALQHVIAGVQRATQDIRRHEFVPLDKAVGYTSAQARHATEAFPPFAASIMDGYAVLAADGARSLTILDAVTAGNISPTTLTTGHAIYITTGAPVPAGADAVVPIEWTQAGANHHEVKILRAVDVGTNIRPVGSDITIGTTVLQAGQLITPAEIGLLASLGHTSIHVLSKPRVGILSTGDEIVPHEAKSVKFGCIRDSNRPMLRAIANAAGAETIDLGLVNDREEALAGKVTAAIEQVDILVLSGGVSMGTHDLLKPLLTRLGTIHFGRLNMKPGKPTTFATVRDSKGVEKLIFGLPGNPVSSLVTAQLLLVPAIRLWTGAATLEDVETSHAYPIVQARLLTDLKQDPQRPEYHRVAIRYERTAKEYHATSTGSQMSSRLLSVCASNGLAIVPAGTSSVPSGTQVEVLLVGEWNLPKVSSSQPSSQQTGATKASLLLPERPAAASSPPSSSSTVAAASTSSAQPQPPFVLRVCVLTVSDRCSREEAEDKSGPAIIKLMSAAALKNTTVEILSHAVVPDEQDRIQAKIREWSDVANTNSTTHPHLILTTGGTGFSPRDITPEAVSRILEKEASGFVYAMLQASFKATPMAALSRPVAGSRRRTLILTLPGSPKAIPEILEPILPLLPHACKLLQDTLDPHVVPPATTKQ